MTSNRKHALMFALTALSLGLVTGLYAGSATDISGLYYTGADTPSGGAVGSDSGVSIEVV